MICRRKPLEFECWTWDGKNEASAPKWISVLSTDHGVLVLNARTYATVLEPGWTVVDWGDMAVRFTPAEFEAEFDLLGVVLPPGCKCSVDEWENVCNPICSEFNPIKSCSKICHTCDHHRGCHAH